MEKHRVSSLLVDQMKVGLMFMVILDFKAITLVLVQPCSDCCCSLWTGLLLPTVCLVSAPR